MKIVGIVSDTGIAAATFKFESPAGTDALPKTTFTLALVANTMNTVLKDVVISHAALTDNQAVVVDVAGGAGAEVVTIFYEYWYET